MFEVNSKSAEGVDRSFGGLRQRNFGREVVQNMANFTYEHTISAEDLHET